MHVLGCPVSGTLYLQSDGTTECTAGSGAGHRRLNRYDMCDKSACHMSYRSGAGHHGLNQGLTISHAYKA